MTAWRPPSCSCMAHLRTAALGHHCSPCATFTRRKMGGQAAPTARRTPWMASFLVATPAPTPRSSTTPATRTFTTPRRTELTPTACQARSTPTSSTTVAFSATSTAMTARVKMKRILPAPASSKLILSRVCCASAQLWTSLSTRPSQMRQSPTSFSLMTPQRRLSPSLTCPSSQSSPLSQRTETTRTLFSHPFCRWARKSPTTTTASSTRATLVERMVSIASLSSVTRTSSEKSGGSPSQTSRTRGQTCVSTAPFSQGTVRRRSSEGPPIQLQTL